MSGFSTVNCSKLPTNPPYADACKIGCIAKNAKMDCSVCTQVATSQGWGSALGNFCQSVCSQSSFPTQYGIIQCAPKPNSS